MKTLINGLKIGHAQNDIAKTGLTIFLFANPSLTVAQIRGSAPATANFSTLDPLHGLNLAHGILFTGGSLFGLHSVSGAMQYLEKQGVGLNLGSIFIPIIPTCAIFDLTVGDCNVRPDATMAYEACINASNELPLMGLNGCGTGSSIGKFMGIECGMPGGFGYATTKIANTNVEVWTFAVVNAMGDIIDPSTNKVIAGTRTAIDSTELLDIRTIFDQDQQNVRHLNTDTSSDIQDSMNSIAKPGQNTTLILTVTNASLNVMLANKITDSAHHGLSSCIVPSHTTYDGDLAICTSLGNEIADINTLCYLTTKTTKQAIINAVKSI